MIGPWPGSVDAGRRVELSDRPDWDDYFLGLVKEVSRRATCDRGRSGCVVVHDKNIVCTGYVGSPPGFPHCDEQGHLLRSVIDDDGSTRQHCVRTVHAEQNAIAQAARRGLALDGSTFYCSMEPCRTCAMLIVNVGATRVVALFKYHAAKDTREIFGDAGIELVVANDVIEAYPDQMMVN